MSKRQADAQASSGKMSRMKESYGEGTASHAGSESCGHGRKAMDEALTGETTGQGESAAKYPKLQDADALTRCGRPHKPPRPRAPKVRGQRPRARTETPRTRTGRSRAHSRRMELRDASGSPRTYADDERAREVGQACSTGEVPEQRRATGGGGDGGKRSGQREPATAKRVPDTEPERRAQCAGAGTASSKQGQEDAVHGAPAPHL